MIGKVKDKPDEKETIDYRLPKSLTPSNYSLYLHPDLEANTFKGQVLISINVNEETKKIILHSHQLNIESVHVFELKGQSLDVESFHFDPKREFLIINMAAALVEDTEIRLCILFSGSMSNKMVGFYSSNYVTPANETRIVVTSKFEPTYARQGFPCFDEPAMKATYEIVLVRPNTGGYHALSNMNIESEVRQKDYTEVYFRKSVPMSTYLACFLISDFASKKRKIKAGGIGRDFDIRVFAMTYQLHKVDFALATAAAVTEFFIDYYQVEYPLPKLDLACIPDFAAGAMENWGLVTFREASLLYDKDFSSTFNKQRIASVVSHELAHMWFGNLVTLNWWDDLWLNEGFARFMEYKGVGRVYPDWQMANQFLIHVMHNVMQLDSLTASHPIINTVANPDQINQMFNTISYDKGASNIRMLEDAVGAEKFAKGVTNYLKRFKYRNATTNDFITELEKLNLDFDVRRFIRTWTEQAGFPVVKVKRSSPNSFRLSQKRYFSNMEDYKTNYTDSKFNYKWTIPLTYFTDIDKEIKRLWFDYEEESLEIVVPVETKWIKLNVYQVGYYRVNYDDGTWNAIISDMINKPEIFDIADRAHLINDVFALADAGQLPFSTAMELSRYLSKEADFVPWFVAATKLQALQSTLRYRESCMEYMQYARGLLEPIYKKVGWEVEEDNHTNNRLRVVILTAASALGVRECLDEAARQFAAWIADNGNKPAADLREIVYYYGMQQIGNDEIWDEMFQRFLKESDASEKLKLLYGLSGATQPWVLHRFINLASNQLYIRNQDYFFCIYLIARNPIGEPILWEYLRENWPNLIKRYGLRDRYFGQMILTISPRFDSNLKLDEMQKFLNKYPDAGAGENPRKEALEIVKLNIKWLEQNEKKLSQWLRVQNCKEPKKIKSFY